MTVALERPEPAATFPGRVEAKEQAALGFRVGGKMVERLVDAGAVVKAGQVLARLDPSDAALQATSAEAQRALAEADAKRYRDLREKNFISQAALDARETALKAAEAQAGLAKNQSGYTTLVADRSGVIAAVSAEVGQVLSAGQPVFRLAPDGEREIAINIPEHEMAAFKAGMPAEISFWNGKTTDSQSATPSEKIAGKLREISPAADPVTRTYAARVSLAKADARLPLGQTANVRFPKADATSAIHIPLAAIFQQGNQPAVWIVGAGDTVSLKPVTVASMSDTGAVVTGGLAGGETIVAAGVHQLTAGEKVRIANAPAAAK
jgi:RND family efflux transporter MFP subunit